MIFLHLFHLVARAGQFVKLILRGVFHLLDLRLIGLFRLRLHKGDLALVLVLHVGDLPVVLGAGRLDRVKRGARASVIIVMIIAAVVILVNFLADLLYQLVDPRIRLR